MTSGWLVIRSVILGRQNNYSKSLISSFFFLSTIYLTGILMYCFNSVIMHRMLVNA